MATDNTKAGSLAAALERRGRVAVVGGIPITANSDRIAAFLAAIAPLLIDANNAAEYQPWG